LTWILGTKNGLALPPGPLKGLVGKSPPPVNFDFMFVSFACL